MKPAPSRKAINQRRYRECQKRGEKVIQLVVNGDDLDAFDKAGLAAWNEDNRETLAQAAREALDEWRATHE